MPFNDEKKSAPIDHTQYVPDPILLHIFSFLANPKDISRVAQVNKRWCERVADSSGHQWQKALAEIKTYLPAYKDVNNDLSAKDKFKRYQELCSKYKGKDGKKDGKSDFLFQLQTVNPLHTAAELGYADVVEFLLDGGLPIDATTPKKVVKHGFYSSQDGFFAKDIIPGVTPLFLAVQGGTEGHYETVKLLITKGANIDFTREDISGHVDENGKSYLEKLPGPVNSVLSLVPLPISFVRINTQSVQNVIKQHPGIQGLMNLAFAEKALATKNIQVAIGYFVFVNLSAPDIFKDYVKSVRDNGSGIRKFTTEELQTFLELAVVKSINDAPSLAITSNRF